VSLACKIFAIFLIVLLLAPLSNAENKDRWFAKDKYEHFAISAIYAGGSTFIAKRHFGISKSQAPVVGFGITISLGAAKEGADFISHKGTASGKDFLWDVAGALAGALAIRLRL